MDIRDGALVAGERDIHVLHVIEDCRDAAYGDTQILRLHGDHVLFPFDLYDAIQSLFILILPDIPAREAGLLRDLNLVFDVCIRLPVLTVQPQKDVFPEIRAVDPAIVRREYADERAMPHQARRRQADRMERNRHTVADQYTLRGVRAPAIHLNVRYIPLRAVLDVADLLGDARNVVRADLDSIVFNPDVVKIAMLSAERDIDKS